MAELLRRFIPDASGATSIEYAIIIAVIGFGVFASVNGVGIVVRGFYDAVAAALLPT